MPKDTSKRRGGFELNNDFPRILTLLRKERGYSQKKVAADLGISQALLSHYEKGIRECGLDFVVRVADYYGVSCDYLLGRTPQRSGAVISVQDLPSGSSTKAKKGENSLVEYDRRILVNSINIVFAILKKINSESLASYLSTYLFSTVYKVFRILYSSNPKNPQDTFSLDSRLFGALVESTIAMSEAKSRYLLSGESIDGHEGVRKEALPTITPETLMRDFPQSASSLFDLIKNTEKSVKSGR